MAPQMVDELNTKLLNLTSEKRALELSHQTTAIKLTAKSEEVEKLMQQNKEVQEVVAQEQGYIHVCMFTKQIYICMYAMPLLLYCVCVCV